MKKTILLVMSCVALSSCTVKKIDLKSSEPLPVFSTEAHRG
jgi:hypothetical protein